MFGADDDVARVGPEFVGSAAAPDGVPRREVVGAEASISCVSTTHEVDPIPPEDAVSTEVAEESITAVGP